MLKQSMQRKVGYCIIILLMFLLVPSASAAFVDVDLGSVYTYQGTNVRYIEAIDVSNISISQMKIASGSDVKTIGSPTIRNVERVFSSPSGTVKGVTITIGDTASTVTYNQALNDYVFTKIGEIPSLYSKIPGKSGVFLLTRFNDSVKKGDIAGIGDLELLQEASYLYVAESPNRAIIYKSVNPSYEGLGSEGAAPPYNKTNLGATITDPLNVFSFDGYTSTTMAQASVVPGKYSAVAMSYAPNNISISGYAPTIIMAGDRVLRWNGATIPATYAKNSGPVTLTTNDPAGIQEISYLIIKSDETYDAKINVDTSKLADKINTEWNSFVPTAPLMSNILENIIRDGVGSGAADPYTYAIKRSSESAYPASATAWSSIAISPGYGISGTAKASSVVVPTAALNTLVPGTYYAYIYATDASLTPLAIDRQTITITAAPVPYYGGGGGGSGGKSVPQFEESTTTGQFQTNSAGIVQNGMIVSATDGLSSVSIAKGVKALDANGQPLGSVTIRTTTDVPSSGSSAFSFAGHAVEMGPAGATFSPAIPLTFKLTEEEWNNLEAGESFAIKWYNPALGEWEDIPTSVNPYTRTVTGKISHFSTFALFKQIIETPTTPPVTQTSAPAETPVPGDATTGGFPWIWVVVVIVLIALIGGGYYYMQQQKK